VVVGVSGEERTQAGADDQLQGEGTDVTTVLAVGPSEVPGDIRDVGFSMAVRGYDRREVDRYVERVNRVIAELEISKSPQAAVKHALDRVGEQTAGVLQRAREAADELTTTALAEADHAARRAKVEAEEMVERAQAEADAIRVQSAQEAEEHLMLARAEAAETLRRARQQADEARRGAEERLVSVERETRAAVDARAEALEEMRRTAAELQQLAGQAEGHPEGGEGAGPGEQAGPDEAEQQTEQLPPVADDAAAADAGGGKGPQAAEGRAPERRSRSAERRSRG
jgi:DivIVA domain-containing protein